MRTISLIVLVGACRYAPPGDTPPGDTVPVNAPPGAPVVAIEAVPTGDGAEDLRCTVVTPGVDPDGDTVTTRLAWDHDGVAFTGSAPDIVAGEVVGADDTARGRVWTCSGYSSDGEVEGAVGAASVELTGPGPGQYAFEKVMDIPAPGDLAVLPDGSLLVATLLGNLHHVEPLGGDDLGSINLRAPDDLISIALDPRFGDGEHDFLYTWTNHTCLISRYVLSLDPLSVSDARDIVEIECPFTPGHAGGDLMFWAGETPEPVLYLAIGPTLQSDAQDPADPGQKILAYSVADDGTVSPGVLDSPFENPYVVALGLRNPWRLTDCGSVMCVPDPGSDYWEEIDLYRAAGMNFGFPALQGPGDGTYDEPVVSWTDDERTLLDADRDGQASAGFVNSPVTGVRASATGYAGRLDGVLLYGEIYDGWIRGLPIDAAGEPSGETIPIANLQYVLSMAETPDGTIYAAEMGGSLQRLIYRADRARLGATGQALSSTGYGSDTIAYAIRYPLWANGADTQRYLQVPAGAAIDTSDPDRWVFPDGTRIFKDSIVDGLKVETAVEEKRDGRWIGGTYVWEGDDAYLTDGRRVTLTLPSGERYPIAADAACAACHDAARGQEWPLGVEAFQLGDEGLQSIAAALDGPPAPAPTVEGSEEYAAVRGYLHGSCGYCHRPGAVVFSVSVNAFDLSYRAVDMRLEGVVAQYYQANPNLENGEPLIVPGEPEESAFIHLVERMKMPPLGVWEPDSARVELLEEWVRAME